MDTRWLTADQERAWRGYLRMRPLLDLQIGRDLRALGVSDADYRVLVVLSETPGHRLRLVELADRIQWTKARLGHHLDRMQARGLVERSAHPTHGRAVLVGLTDVGLRRLEEIAPGHVESVRRHFVDLLEPEQLAVLADVCERVIEHLRHTASGSAAEDGTADRGSDEC